MTEEPVTYSPRIGKKFGVDMSFPQAIAVVILGGIIAKEEWEDKDSCCMLRDGWLMIRRKGKWHQWLINDGDIMGADWYTVE